MLSELVKIEKIEVDDDEIEEAIEKTSLQFGESAEKIREMLRKDSGRRSLELDLISDNALNRLQANAKGETIELAESDTATQKHSDSSKDKSSDSSKDKSTVETDKKDEKS